jgi:hypothetical protein
MNESGIIVVINVHISTVTVIHSWNFDEEIGCLSIWRVDILEDEVCRPPW